ncbi:MAG: tRNA pseudouridine(55) synthase TruB [Bacteroidota bacterium]|nr:tRNA pseudouridine(55) synthase TruB [Bacteroidota bacterium]MDP4230171.1 tRNA pseudouridine(55) synthase TruB [Bacteroidota bacterium]MDP4236636.1 tRNA pseudouridine(55) synthase TruB [Bacteroidota bacterium]
MPDSPIAPPILTLSDYQRDPLSILPALNDEQGALLLLDKPYGVTSFSMVNRFRHILTKYSGDKWVKVGHGGTLDPLATGLLIIATRKATRSLTQLLGLGKTYWCELRLGITTPSFDLETPIKITGGLEGITSGLVLAAVSNFVGDQLQRPPIFSAVKLRGKPMYKHARKGREIEMAQKNITIHSIVGIEIEIPYVRFRAECSKGTYIRSLASDIGTMLGTGAVLTNLRREKIGDWNIADALTEDKIESLIQPN